MKRILAFALLIVVAYGPARSSVPTQSAGCLPDAPKDDVEALWNRAARGDLLTQKGWALASAFFTEPGAAFDNKVVQVMSDYYGVNSYTIEGTTATIDMEYTDLGNIDSALRYHAPPETNAYKTSMRYKLVSGPSYVLMYGPDGKTLVGKKEVPGVTLWRIEGHPSSPWTTVNGAIRYVLEMRDKTANPAIKKNVDETIVVLLKMH